MTEKTLRLYHNCNVVTLIVWTVACFTPSMLPPSITGALIGHAYSHKFSRQQYLQTVGHKYLLYLKHLWGVPSTSHAVILAELNMRSLKHFRWQQTIDLWTALISAQHCYFNLQCHLFLTCLVRCSCFPLAAGLALVSWNQLAVMRVH